MLKRLCLLILLCAPSVFAQFTTVTATVTDPNGIPYAGAVMNAVLVPSTGGGYTLGGQPYSGRIGPVTLDSSGSFTVNFGDVTLISPGSPQWQITIDSAAATIGPSLGTGPQSFTYTSTGTTISGSSPVSLTNSLNSLAHKLTNFSGAGSGTLNYVGQVINVVNSAYGASPLLADNATAFAAAASAANSTAYASVGTPTIRSSVKTTMSLAAISSATATVNISAGDTVLIGTIALNGAGVLTYSVSDGTNTYYPINLNSSPVGTFNEQVQVFGTPAGTAKAFSGTLTVTITAGGPAQFGFFVLDAFNVGSFGQTNLFNSATANNTPTVAATTQDNNNIIATFMDYCNATGVTISANTGTLQQSWNSTATICGAGLVTNTAASLHTSVTTSASLSAGSTWAVNGLELRSVTPLIPTVYFPAGRYTYSSGLSFTNAVTLKGEPGSVLCYMGTAHAVDMGPTGLTFATLQPDPYVVDGLRFECGAGMTQGIVFQNNVIYGEARNNTFWNFGNTTSAAIFSNGDTEDLWAHHNKFLIFDGPPAPATVPSRKFVDITTSAQFSTARIQDNFMICAAGKLGAGVGCGTTSGTLVKSAGYANIITGNNVSGGFCPAFAIVFAATGGEGTRIAENNIETDQNSCYGITYTATSGVASGLKVIGNYWNNKASSPTTTALVGPSDASQILFNAEVSNNIIDNNPTNNPIVAQNNLVGQTGNTGTRNLCSTGQGTTTTPCPLLHTTGGNINQWNNDYGGTCTMNGSTGCPVYNFLTTYGAAPKCTASWTGSGTLAGVVKTAVSTSALTITSSTSTDTAVVNWNCNPDAE